MRSKSSMSMSGIRMGNCKGSRGRRQNVCGVSQSHLQLQLPLQLQSQSQLHPMPNTRWLLAAANFAAGKTSRREGSLRLNLAKSFFFSFLFLLDFFFFQSVVHVPHYLKSRPPQSILLLRCNYPINNSPFLKKNLAPILWIQLCQQNNYERIAGGLFISQTVKITSCGS